MDGGEIQQALSSEMPQQEALKESLGAQSAAQMYLARDKWQVPDEDKLKECHPLTGHAFWQVILGASASGIAQSELEFADIKCQVTEAWPAFVQRISWWEYLRCFRKVGSSLRFKPLQTLCS